jgi:hypothetical protein
MTVKGLCDRQFETIQNQAPKRVRRKKLAVKTVREGCREPNVHEATFHLGSAALRCAAAGSLLAQGAADNSLTMACFLLTPADFKHNAKIG